jgi:PAS domain S-box-containing protein
VQLDVRPLSGSDGSAGYQGTAADITDRKYAQEELLHKEEQARHLIRHAPAAVYEIDFRGPTFVSVNDVMCEQSGYSRQELLATNPLELLEEKSSVRFRERIQKALAGESLTDVVEYKVKAKDGHDIWAVLNVSLTYEDGKPVGALVVGHDVTERKRAENERERLLAQEQHLVEELAAANEELQAQTEELAAREKELEAQNEELRTSQYNRSLIEAALDPLVTIGLGGKITDVNEATIRITGRVRDELVGTDFSDYFTDPESASQGYREVFDKGSVTDYPLTIRGRDGKLTDVLYNASLYRDNEGKVLGVFAAARDITALRELEVQRDIASKLQRTLLDVPQDTGGIQFGHLYRSATKEASVGGDFYDVFTVKDGRIAVLIGDVSGHGVEAARIATLVKDVTHAFAHQSRRPSVVLNSTNELLLENRIPGFVTLFLGILDPEAGMLTYSSAGHPNVLLRANGEEVKLLDAASSPLGIFPDQAWKESDVQLSKGDLLLLYTDGAIEARRDGEFFGQEGLIKVLTRWSNPSPEPLPQALLAEVLAFSGGVLTDDVALLAFCLSQDPSLKSTRE